MKTRTDLFVHRKYDDLDRIEAEFNPALRRDIARADRAAAADYVAPVFGRQPTRIAPLVARKPGATVPLLPANFTISKPGAGPTKKWTTIKL